jgi:PAS domain S-box-containing protein
MSAASGTPNPPQPPPIQPDLLLAAIVDSSDDAIVSKDLNGVVTSWNKGAERIFGYTAQEMVGRPITTIIPPDRRHEEPQILARLRRGERVDHFDSIRLRKDGTEVHVSLTISPVRDASGVVIGASKIARDVTERKRWEQQEKAQTSALREATDAAVLANEEAERQSRLKDEFLATLSHELRTPLQSILGWTQLLLNDDHFDPEEARRALQVIDRNARSQVRIIEDLLDMSRILSGRVKLDVQRVAIGAVLMAAVDTVRPAAVSKGVALDVRLPSQEFQVSGDPARLQQIFWNLLSNAVKFTGPGGTVTATVTRVNSHVEISVTDTGAGIDPEFLPHVFERFRQGDSSTTRKQGGLGLGLAIVKHLTELHGGSVSARSPGLSLGSTFSVQLPAAKSDRDPATGFGPEMEGRGHQRQPVLQGARLLVVDDEADALDILATVLTKAGGRVAKAHSARAALDAFQSMTPDLLISDIGMPEMDGLALIRQIRALPPDRGGGVPAVALSAYSRVEDRIAALAAGYQMHVAKPADTNELLTIVNSLLKMALPAEQR